MSLDAVIAIVCLVGAVVIYAAYRHCSKNVYLRYQR